MATKELTAADLAHYHVTLNTSDGTQTRTVTAAYVTKEDKMPGWLLLKDHQHRTVAQFNDHLVFMVERGDPDDAGEDS